MADRTWGQFRQQMPVTKRWAYLDHAAVAPLPAPSAAAIQQWAEQAATEGATVWPDWSRRVQQVRQRAAEMLNARPNEVALVPSTTAGISLVAEGYPWQSGDNVVTLDGEFPSNWFPWLNLAEQGVQTRRVACPGGRVDLGALIEACDRKTRIVAVSWIGYASGWRLDVARLAEQVHKRGALLMLDAIQGIGLFPLDVELCDVDFLAADGHKWMLGPEGAGLFFLKREHLNRLRPVGVGWQSVVDRYDFGAADFQLRDEAARYEGGSLNMLGFAGLGASLDLLGEHGLKATESPLADRVLEICDDAIERLASIGASLVYDREADHASGIVTFSIPHHDPRELRTRCRQEGVVVSVRGGGLRISVHAYNDQSDIDRLIEVLTRTIGRRTTSTGGPKP